MGNVEGQLSHVTQRSRVLLEKLQVRQIVQKFSEFYGTQFSLRHWQSPAICPNLEPDKSRRILHLVSLRFILIQGCWQVLSPTRKETSYSDRRFWCSYVLFIITIGGILVLYIYMYVYIITLTSNEIFSPSNKIHREVGRAKDLSAPLYYPHTHGWSNKRLFPSRLPPKKTLLGPLPSPIRATCPVKLTVPFSSTWITFYEMHRTWSFSFCARDKVKH